MIGGPKVQADTGAVAIGGDANGATINLGARQSDIDAIRASQEQLKANQNNQTELIRAIYSRLPSPENKLWLEILRRISPELKSEEQGLEMLRYLVQEFEKYSVAASLAPDNFLGQTQRAVAEKNEQGELQGAAQIIEGAIQKWRQKITSQNSTNIKVLQVLERDATRHAILRRDLDSAAYHATCHAELDHRNRLAALMDEHDFWRTEQDERPDVLVLRLCARLADTALAIAEEGEDLARALSMGGAAYGALAHASPDPDAAITAVLRFRGARNEMAGHVDRDFDCWLHIQTSKALCRLALINNDAARLQEAIDEAESALAKAGTPAQRAQALSCRAFAGLARSEGNAVEATKIIDTVRAAISELGEEPTLLLTLSQALATRAVDRLSREDAGEALAAARRGLQLVDPKCAKRTSAVLLAARANAHAKLGQIDNDVAQLREAVKLYQEALALLNPNERETTDTGADWNEIRMNYGDALIYLAERERDLSGALKAVEIIGESRMALQVRGAHRSSERAQLIHCYAMVVAEQLGAPPFLTDLNRSQLQR